MTDSIRLGITGKRNRFIATDVSKPITELAKKYNLGLKVINL